MPRNDRANSPRPAVGPAMLDTVTVEMRYPKHPHGIV